MSFNHRVGEEGRAGILEVTFENQPQPPGATPAAPSARLPAPSAVAPPPAAQPGAAEAAPPPVWLVGAVATSCLEPCVCQSLCCPASCGQASWCCPACVPSLAILGAGCAPLYMPVTWPPACPMLVCPPAAHHSPAVANQVRSWPVIHCWLLWLPLPVSLAHLITGQ